MAFGVLAFGVLLAGCWDPLVREVFDTDEPGGFGSPPGDVGEQCTPADEDHPEYAGSSTFEVAVSTEDARCQAGKCLVNKFQGRVSCPEGNLAGGECFTPQGELVSVPVEAQLPERPAADSVYCSCRCGGPAQYAPFCECPSDMVCEDLFAGSTPAPIGVDYGQGSYCVKR